MPYTTSFRRNNYFKDDYYHHTYPIPSPASKSDSQDTIRAMSRKDSQETIRCAPMQSRQSSSAGSDSERNKGIAKNISGACSGLFKSLSSGFSGINSAEELWSPPLSPTCSLCDYDITRPLKMKLTRQGIQKVLEAPVTRSDGTSSILLLQETSSTPAIRVTPPPQQNMFAELQWLLEARGNWHNSIPSVGYPERAPGPKEDFDLLTAHTLNPSYNYDRTDDPIPDKLRADWDDLEEEDQCVDLPSLPSEAEPTRGRTLSRMRTSFQLRSLSPYKLKMEGSVISKGISLARNAKQLGIELVSKGIVVTK